MKFLIYIILFVGTSLCVDILSIQVPDNVKSLSYNGFGIALRDNYSVNPASLSKSEHSYFEFSNNQWLFDIRGSYFSCVDGSMMFSSHYWEVDDIESYGNEPASSALYTFGSKTYFLQLAQGLNFKNHHFGYSMKYVYMNLLEYDNKGFALDLGYQFDFNSGLSFALLINNISTGFKDQDQLPQIAVIGASQKFNNIPIELSMDIFFEYEESQYSHGKGSGLYQGFSYNNQYFDFIASHCYYSDTKENDIAFGFRFLWKNLGFSISTIIKEQESIGAPLFSQLSYYF